MDEREWLAERFEQNRARLRAVAYRLLGSAAEAEDAVQEAWIRLSRSDTDAVDNLEGWLTTVVSRVCLDALRSRRTHRESPLDAQPEAAAPREDGIDPESEAMMAETVGLAMLVVLQRLAPAERIAFVLHDLFDLSFDEIAPIVGRSSVAARQIASRARRRVRDGASTRADQSPNSGGPAGQQPIGVARQRQVVDAFLAAAREGDLESLIAALDSGVVFRPDRTAIGAGPSKEVRGAQAVAKLVTGRAHGAHPALINGSVGLIVAPRGRLVLALQLSYAEGRIASIDVLADSARLAALDIGVLQG